MKQLKQIAIYFLFVSLLSVAGAFGQTTEQRKLELVVQTGHSSVIFSVAFSPDGKILASGSQDSTIKLWSVETGQQIKSLDDHEGGVQSVAFSPDGKTLASGSQDSTVKIWNIETGEVIKTLEDTEEVYSIAFSFDGKILASGGESKTIKLWDIVSGKLIRSLKGHTDSVQLVAFSPDGKILVSNSNDKTIKLWNIGTGQITKSLVGNASAIAFSSDGKALAIAGADYTIKLWNIESEQIIKSLKGHTKTVGSIVFSPDGETLASGSEDNTIKLWSIVNGKEIKSLKGHNDTLYGYSDGEGNDDEHLGSFVAFSPDGKLLLSSGEDRILNLWNVKTGKQSKSFEGHVGLIGSVAFSPDGNNLVSGGIDTSIKLWNIKIGEFVKTFDGVGFVTFSPDGKTLASGGIYATVNLWNIEDGREIKSFEGHDEVIYEVKFSHDGKILASGSSDKTIKLWDVESGRLIKTLKGHTESISSIEFSPDAKMLASSSLSQNQDNDDYAIRLWNVISGKQIKSLEGHTLDVCSTAFSPDGKTLASGSIDGTIKLWNVISGKQINSLEGANSCSIKFSRDGKTLLSFGGSLNNKTTFWNVESGRQIKSLTVPTYESGSEAFSPNGNFFAGSKDGGTIKIWNTKTNELLATLISLDKDDWVVIDSEGRFDASDGALKWMHYTYGLEVINLDQLKEAYYEPDLLAKLLGYNKEPLRPIVPLKDVRLYPEIVEQTFDEKTGKLTIKLKNRGGGIGETRVLVNGKLAVADARDAKLIANPNVANGAIEILTVDLKGASVLKGKENKIEVITSNYLKEIGKGNIQSRGAETFYVDDGKENFTLPSLYAIVGGVSDYDGSAIDLRFAAKDAEDFSNALSLGAKRLFCDRSKPDCLDKVQITTLSTSGKDGTIQPTKENFRKAFEDIAKKAKPEDIIVIYLAGHGVSFGTGTDTYFYLTKEARSASKEDLSKVYQTVAISSTELTEWLTTKEWTAGEKGIKALKQVLILDTCASGTAAAALTAKRDLSGDQIRAIEFLKDKTGTFVLMGSTADAPSYEASQFGQGLLTYSLLQAMKGAELDKGEFIDVRKLFTYAEREVPKMATNIGGVQRPIVSAPLGKTFVIGQMTDTEKKQIDLPTPKPIILRPQLGMLPRNNDPLNLTIELRKGLDAESSYEVVRSRGGKEPILIYVDDDSFPGAIQITGTYSVEGENVKVKVYLFKGDKEVAELPEVISTKEEVIKKLLAIIRTELTKIN